MASSSERVRIKLDFDTPNKPPAAAAAPVAPRRTPSAAKPRPICPYCFQPGLHTTARQCFNALER